MPSYWNYKLTIFSKSSIAVVQYLEKKIKVVKYIKNKIFMKSILFIRYRNL